MRGFDGVVGGCCPPYDIAPIPGTKRRKYLEDNAGAVGVRLDAADLARIDAALPPGAAAGERYSAIGMRLTDA
jgi:diketogulonate reductase-like aldo/keto reductase